VRSLHQRHSRMRHRTGTRNPWAQPAVARDTFGTGCHVGFCRHHGTHSAVHAARAGGLARRRCSLHQQRHMEGAPQAQGHQKCPEKALCHGFISITRVNTSSRYGPSSPTLLTQQDFHPSVAMGHRVLRPELFVLCLPYSYCVSLPMIS
jgi:hypothetical protein